MEKNDLLNLKKYENDDDDITTKTFRVFRNTNQSGGFDHYKVITNGEYTAEVRTHKFGSSNEFTQYNIQTKKEYIDELIEKLNITDKEKISEFKKEFTTVDYIPHYKVNGKFNNICEFTYETLRVTEEHLIFNENFELSYRFFKENEDVLEINDELVSLLDYEPYNVYNHNNNLPKREGKTAKINELKTKANSLTKAELLELINQL